MLSVEHISFSYRKKEVLHDISFTAKKGDFIGIIGKNGCGKSTLLSVLAGVRRPASGTLSFQDAPLFSKKSDPADTIGYVPQLNPLLPELSVRDNLKLWLRNKKDTDTGSTESLYRQMGLTDYLQVPVAKLSEGLKKRVSIASVLQNNPKILILDEPSAALDLPCKEIIHEQLLSFTKNGGIVLFTTHEEVEFSLCNTLYILKDGYLHHVDDTTDKHALIQQF
ncbi:MAG: heme ABC exporter ATP-binding protein CcmA [Lachnospiraceae bacterium]|nr:heme ABC exporter ATP-binding protein CcmA [Lachnospiraceae bacterium]